jgi:hypothetical protein
VRKAVAAAAAVLALGAAAVAAVPLVERHVAERVKEEIEAPGLTTVEDVRVGLFDRSVTFTGLRARGPEGVSAASWSLSGLAWPLGELVRGHTPFEGWGPGQPLRARHVEMRDVRLSDGLRTWTAASLSADGLDLGRYDSDAGPSSGPFGGQSAVQDVIAGARVVGALAIERLEIADFGFSDVAGMASFSAASLRASGIDRGLLGAVLVSGLQVPGGTSAEPAFRLDEVEVRRLDLTRMLRAAAAPGWRPGRPLGRVNLEHGHAAGFGGGLMSRYGFALDRVTIDVVRDGGDVARTRSKVEGFVYSPPLRGLESIQARAVMAAMGLAQVRLDLDCQATEDRARGEARIERCVLAGPELAEIEFSAALEKADAGFWSALDGHDAAALSDSGVVLARARLVLADRGLIDKAFRGVALLSRQTAAQARQDFAREVRRFQPAGVLITEELTKLLDTAARFVEGGGTLTVQANPDPPFGVARIGYLMRPGPDLIDLLGITAMLEPRR